MNHTFIKTFRETHTDPLDTNMPKGRGKHIETRKREVGFKLHGERPRKRVVTLRKP